MGEPVGVEAAADVALQDADTDVAGVLECPLQQRGLAGAGGAHQVDDGDAGGIEVGAVGLGDGLVGVERALGDADGGLVHVTRLSRLRANRGLALLS